MGLDNPIHLLLLLVVLLLVFGAKRLPEMGRSLGDGLRGFKESISGESAVHHEPAVHQEPAVHHLDAAPVQTPVTPASETTDVREPTLVP
jgi:sec-independent protein translocase protein TatA